MTTLSATKPATTPTELYSYKEGGQEICYTKGQHGSFQKTTTSPNGRLSTLPLFEEELKKELKEAIEKHGISKGDNADKQIAALINNNIFTDKQLQTMGITVDMISDAHLQNNSSQVRGVVVARNLSTAGQGYGRY